MVSYSCHPTMPSNDFDLYPSQEEQQYGLLAHSQYPASAQAYHFTTFDAQPNIHAFSAPQSSNMYAFKQNYLPYSPAASPASGSQSFEVCPPHLSTASESTASAQSTSPSAAGSPSMGQQFIEQPWSVLGQGLGLAPGLEPAEPFTTCGFEFESMVAPDSKISGCVGESKVSSPSQASARTAFPFAIPPFSASARSRPRAFSAASQSVAPSKREDVFKTPTTPASAMVSLSPSSASVPHQSTRRSAAAVSANRRRRSSLLSSQMRPSGAPAELSAGIVPANASASPVSQVVSASPQAASNASSSPMDSSCRFPLFPSSSSPARWHCFPLLDISTFIQLH